MGRLFPNLPPQAIPLTLEKHYAQLWLYDKHCRILDCKNIFQVTIARLGMYWTRVHAITQYFSQGMSLANRKCIIDLRVSLDGKGLVDFITSILVMLSPQQR